MFSKTCQIITAPDKEKLMSKKLNILVSAVLVSVLSGCNTLSEDRMTDLDRMADRSITKLRLERGIEGELNTCAGYVVANVNRSIIPTGNPVVVNGVLVRAVDGAHFYMKISGLKFDGADGVRKLTAIIMIPDQSDIEQALNGVLKIDAAPESRRVFVSAEHKKFAVYYLETVRIEPAADYSSEEEAD